MVALVKSLVPADIGAPVAIPCVKPLATLSGVTAGVTDGVEGVDMDAGRDGAAGAAVPEAEGCPKVWGETTEIP